MKREEEDYFERLPDDVIIDIFDRVNDSKLLTQCLLLSKRIASLIRLVSSIKIHIPSIKEYDVESVSWWSDLTNLSNDIEFQSRWKLRMDNSSFLIRKAREVLHHFSQVKTAIVEHPVEFAIFDFRDPNTMWWIEYSGGGVNTTGIIKSCAFLIPIMTTLDARDRVKILIRVIVALFTSSITLYPMVAQMAQDHESLRDILVTTNYSRKGWIHAGEDEIVKMRQANDVSSINKLMKVKVWYNVTIPNPPEEDSNVVYAFVVVGSPDNIDNEVKAATNRFWGDCNYWTEHHDDLRINMRELVETMPCHLEFTWILN